MAQKAARHATKRYKNILLGLFSACIVGLVIGILVFLYYASQIPDPSILSARRISESTKIYDRTGNVLLYDIHGEEKRTIIPWEDIPSSIKNATLAAEDNDFYKHKGIDIRGILRAFYKDVTSLSASQGGSTITQQLIKKSLLGDEKTLARKVKEIVLSIQVERNFSKDYIFWMYLNQIPYGSNTYGIEAASQTYFGKNTKGLTLAEAATLASMPKAPTYYSPYGNHVDQLLARRNSVLSRMKTLGMIDEDEYLKSSKEELVARPIRDAIIAPHFVIMVRSYLEEKYGKDMIENGGLTVTTTLDAKLQALAEAVVTKYGKINAERYKATNAALVTLDPRDGSVKALVGSRDYFDVEHEGNFNVATGGRQPGSSFKPFAYATAFSRGFTDSTILFDLPTEFNPNCDPATTQTAYRNEKCYHPGNYDGRFRGPVTMRQSLAQSLNVPSVQTLYLAGIDDTIETAHALGITTLNDRSRLGLSLVLGGGEVRLLDMVSAYGVFANDGVRVPTGIVQKIVGRNGVILEERQHTEQTVMNSGVARILNDILSDNNTRGPVFGYTSPLYFPDRPVAAKTGTTQENRDGWLVGYTPTLVTGVWTGNNDNTSMTRQGAGVSAAGPMWHEFMTQAFRGTPVALFTKPNPIETGKIMLNGEYIGPEGIHSTLYYINRDNPAGSRPDNPYMDPQFKNWETAVQNWVNSTFGQTPILPDAIIISPTPTP